MAGVQAAPCVFCQPGDHGKPELARPDVGRTFRARLSAALARSGLSRTSLASRAGLDRSTLTQLLSPELDRLPRADTAAALAAELEVSLDWLVGLSTVEKSGVDVLDEALRLEPSAPQPLDDRLLRWFREAAGSKIRIVPTTWPDFAKTEDTLRHEYRVFAARSVERAIVEAHAELERLRLPETDLEVVSSYQALTDFADGAGIWSTLEASARLRQIELFHALTKELYPSLRVYLFDGLTHYSAPYTIFGRQRAALYVGQQYLVFNTPTHVSAFHRHFDELVRAAAVTPTAIGAFLSELRKRVRAHR